MNFGGTTHDLAVKIERLEHHVGELRKQSTDVEAKLVALKAEYAKRTAPRPAATVSDHALLRYMERVLELDIDGLRENILGDTLLDAMAAGAKSVTIDGVKYEFKGNVVTTIMTPERKRKKGGPKPPRDDGAFDDLL